ncbi:MAG: hypothetical protein IT378_09905 [Sandaracinaceae bacterium]|nr:hypothetical protein [Sandaracinaceae bacterium]
MLEALAAARAAGDLEPLVRALVLASFGLTSEGWALILALARDGAIHGSLARSFASAVDRAELADELAGRAPSPRLAHAHAAQRTGRWREVRDEVIGLADAQVSLDELREIATLLEADDELGPVLARVRRRIVEAAPDDPGALAALAQLALWSLDLDGAGEAARALEAAHPADPAGPRVRAAVHVLRGDAREAIGFADRSLALDPDDVEAMLWRAEASLRASDLADASAWVERAAGQGAQQFPVSVLRAHIDARIDAERALRAGVPAPQHDRAAVEHRYPKLFGPHLRRWAAGEEEIEMVASVEKRREVTGRILADLGGNRTSNATVVVETERGVVLARVHPRSPRRLSGAALQRVVGEPLESVLHDLDALHARFPGSPQPLCYRGELRLWLGDYEQALRDFERAETIRPSRWVFVGQAAVHVLQGDWERARRPFDRCAALGHTKGETTRVYLGEAHRRRGELPAALSQLRAAVAERPSRLGAWINLALAAPRSGDGPGAEDALANVRALAPALLLLASERAGAEVPAAMDGGAEAVLEECLALMRGTRSSTLITYVDGQGTLRVLPRPERIAAVARDALQALAPPAQVRPALRVAEALVGPLAASLVDLQIRDVQAHGDGLHLLVGRESTLARLRLRAGGAPWRVHVEVAPAQALQGEDRLALERLAREVAGAVTPARWRAAMEIARSTSARG